MDPQPGPAAFDRADADVLAPRLAGCLRAAEWVDRLLVGRPYRTLTALEQAAVASALDLSEPGLAEALAEHPRAPATPPGDGPTLSTADRPVAVGASDRLHAATVAYEARFGHPLVMRTTGRTEDEVLRAAQDRLGNDPTGEGVVVRQQLGEIAVLRLHDLLAELVTGADAEADEHPA